MGEPAFSINFTAKMIAASACEKGDALVFDSDAGYWKVATEAVRTALGKRAEAIALSAYGGSAVGKVSYQMTGVLANEIGELGDGLAKWVRVSTTGRLERVTTPGVGDDLVGKTAVDGRVALDMGKWDSTNYAGGGGGGGSTPGEPANSIQAASDDASALVGVTGWSFRSSQSVHVKSVGPGIGFLSYGPDPEEFFDSAFGLIRLPATPTVQPVHLIFSKHNGGAEILSYHVVSENDEGYIIIGGLEANPWTGIILKQDTTVEDNLTVEGDLSVDGESSFTGDATFDNVTVTGTLTADIASDATSIQGTPVDPTPPDGDSYLRYDPISEVAYWESSDTLGWATSLQGFPIDADAAPDDGDTLVWDWGDNEFKFAPAGGATPNGNSNDILTSNGAGDFGTPIVPATGIATFLTTPSGANFASALTSALPLTVGGTGLTAVPGSDTHVLFNDSSAYGADDGFTYSKSTDTATLAGALNAGTFLSVGTHSVATGLYRVPNNTVAIASETSGGTDFNVLATNASAQILIGQATTNGSIIAASVSDINMRAGGFFFVTNQSGSSTRFQITTTTIDTALPVGGYASGTVPFRFRRSAITQSTTSDLTLSAAQYSCPLIDISGTPGGNFNVIAPNSEGATFNVNNLTENQAKFGDTSGTGATIATATSRWVAHNGTDYELRET